MATVGRWNPPRLHLLKRSLKKKTQLMKSFQHYWLMTAKEPDAAPVEADPELLRPVLPEVADPVVVAEGPDTVPVDPAGVAVPMSCTKVKGLDLKLVCQHAK
ncbi:hypothetical protein RBB50_010314 [Rhinocladiella similis]